MYTFNMDNTASREAVLMQEIYEDLGIQSEHLPEAESHARMAQQEQAQQASLAVRFAGFGLKLLHVFAH